MAPGFHELSTFLPGCPVMVFHCPDNSAVLNPEEAVASGVRAVLMKPMDCSELSGAVRRVLDEQVPEPAERHGHGP